MSLLVFTFLSSEKIEKKTKHGREKKNAYLYVLKMRNQ